MIKLENADSERSLSAEKSAYLWNTAGSMLNAFQSVLMLMVLTRVCDVHAAGVFSFAYASANLFLGIGNYGMRNFQASDVSIRYSFPTYVASRFATDAVMLVFSMAYLAFSANTLGYSPDKTSAILLMMLLKTIDSLEDVFDGNYQRVGRLDLGGKLQTARLLTVCFVFGFVVWGTGTLTCALICALAASLIVLVGGVLLIRIKWGVPRGGGAASLLDLRNLILECTPLFLASFLTQAINNMPKYAIDSQMTDSAQAIYGFIAMPVFVVGLLAQFIYMPIVRSLSFQWGHGDTADFRRRIGRQVVLIAGMTVVCDLGAVLIGAQILGLLYNTDLSNYILELVVLVTAGGFNALATLMTMGITIMREQRHLTIGYAVVAVAAFVLSPVAVRAAGITGASWIYLAMMVVLATWFTGVFVWYSSIDRNEGPSR